MRRREASWRTRHNSEPWSDKSVLDAWMKTLWKAVEIMTFMRNMVFMFLALPFQGAWASGFSQHQDQFEIDPQRGC